MRILRTLLIGGAGFIGLNLIPLLLSSGREITVVGRRNFEGQLFPQGVEYVRGDFADLALLTRLLNSHDEVIHLANASVPNTSHENPLTDLFENLVPSVQLFSEVAKRGLKLLLVSSGGTVYGEAEDQNINESHPTRPISPYGLTKLTLENYAKLYSITKDLNYLCVRPSNAYGVGQIPFKGQGFISTAVASIISEKAVDIYGPSGSIRDYLYITDLVKGILKVLDQGKSGETYNIGSGKGRSNIDVIFQMEPLIKEMGYIVNINHLPDRKFDVKYNCLDCAKINKHTGWSPEISFQDGLKSTINWLEKSYTK